MSYEMLLAFKQKRRELWTQLEAEGGRGVELAEQIDRLDRMIAHIQRTRTTIQDREPNFRDPYGRLYLLRCFRCNPRAGRENLMHLVATSVCGWCKWKESDRVKP